MAHPNEDLVREAFAAAARGDMDARQKFWADDIRYHIPGRGPQAGVYEGREQVLQMLVQVSELTGGTLRSELHDVLASDEHVVVLTTQRAKRAGKQYTDNSVFVYHIRDGKVAEVWIHFTDQYGHDEFLA